MKMLDIVQRASACLEKLPERQISADTEVSYRKTFARMWREPTLDALAPSIALDTFYHRRAALHWVGRSLLEDFRAKCFAAAECGDAAVAKRRAAILLRFLDRIEPALERDPPVAAGLSPLQSPSSRWRASAGAHPPRGINSKRNVLGLLPANWDKWVWQAALEEWSGPDDQQELDALAVELSAPVRPEEFMPGERADGWSEGVLVELRSPRRLDIKIAPAKSHGGRYGTGTTIVKIDPVKAGGPAAYLAARCVDAGGKMVITIRSKNTSRKKLARLGQIALPDCDVTITPYVCRNQLIADFKATLGAGAAVAAAAGHCTDRTQAKYGHAQHGRKRPGLIGVACKRAPRAGNVARGHELASKRRYSLPKPLT